MIESTFKVRITTELINGVPHIHTYNFTRTQFLDMCNNYWLSSIPFSVEFLSSTAPD